MSGRERQRFCNVRRMRRGNSRSLPVLQELHKWQLRRGGIHDLHRLPDGLPRPPFLAVAVHRLPVGEVEQRGAGDGKHIRKGRMHKL